MRVALVIPAWRPEDLFPPQTARLQVNYWQPLGLLYLAAVLERRGHQVAIIDGAFLSAEELLEKVRGFAPGLVGIQANTFLWPRAQATARAVKDMDPGVFTCLGGQHGTALGAACLGPDSPGLDAVVVGEGEETLAELVRALERGLPLEGIAGLVFRRGERVVANPPRPLIEDLDGLPFPARHLLGDPGLYLPPPGTYRAQPVATMMTSRGCRGRCVYCFQMDPERQVRFRSLENVLDEIELCLAQGYREIRFLDDNLLADPQRVRALCRGIRERELEFPWFASSCVQQVEPKLLQEMAAAGCWAILFGAESGVQKDLNALRKGSTPAQIAQAVNWAKRAGLHVVLPFLLGIPGQTRADFLASVEFACRLDPAVANFHAIAPFPGTELHATAPALGTLSSDCADYSFQGFAFVPQGMTRQEMAELRSLAFRAFYLRPKVMLRQLRSLRGWGDVKRLLLGLRGLFWLWARHDLFKRRQDR